MAFPTAAFLCCLQRKEHMVQTRGKTASEPISRYSVIVLLERIPTLTEQEFYT